MTIIDEYLVYLRAGTFAKTTIDARDRCLDLLDWEMQGRIKDATPTDLALFIQEHGSGSDWTKCTYYAHLHGFYGWLARQGLILKDPTLELMKPKRPKPRPKPVIDKDLELALQMSNARWRLIITLAAYNGLRCNEIRNLKREHVTVEVLQIWGGKGNKDAELPTHPRVWQLVGPLPEGYVLNPRPKTSTHLSNEARHHFNRLGLRHVTIHKFRHSFGTNLVRSGTDLRTAQELLRHANLSSTQMYTDVSKGQMLTAIRGLPQFGPGEVA